MMKNPFFTIALTVGVAGILIAIYFLWLNKDEYKIIAPPGSDFAPQQDSSTFTVASPDSSFPLKRGDTGNYVGALQRYLNDYPSLKVPEDAMFGETTENAVIFAMSEQDILPSNQVPQWFFDAFIRPKYMP